MVKKMDNKGQTSVNLFVGLFIMIIGVAGSIFLGLGIVYAKESAAFIGELMISVLAVVVIVMRRLLE